MELSLSALLTALVWLCIIGGVFWMLWWFVGFIGLPEPFNKVARIIIGIVALIVLVNFLLGLTSSGPLFRLR